jgi:hypothetical protein
MAGYGEGNMKLKRTLFLLMLFVSFSFIMLLGPVCTAQHAAISIENVNIPLIETRPPVGETTIHEYKIIVILHNTGDTQSVNITVKFKEPQPGMGANLTMQPESYSLMPNETKTFVFENWPTPLSGDIPINISFGPSSPNIIKTEENSGSYIYTLSINGEKKTTSTPGFEIACVLVAILVLLIGRRIKK